MKTLSVFAFIICSLFISQPIAAQTLTKETIKVWGNCGMCQETIEKAANKKGDAKDSLFFIKTFQKRLNESGAITFTNKLPDSAQLNEAVKKYQKQI